MGESATWTIMARGVEVGERLIVLPWAPELASASENSKKSESLPTPNLSLTPSFDGARRAFLGLTHGTLMLLSKV